MASVGIGYVTGDNDFFHLRPSAAEWWDIPADCLLPSVRNGKALPPRVLTSATVDRWRTADEQILLLRLPKQAELPSAVRRYLDTTEGREARQAYKCRTRDPWYSVPDVQVPDFFLSYMSGMEPSLVRNAAACTCTNSVHGVRLKGSLDSSRLLALWDSPIAKLSCEIEGHPLGGGMLKLEPGEATRIFLPAPGLAHEVDMLAIQEAIGIMRTWRHYGDAAGTAPRT